MVKKTNKVTIRSTSDSEEKIDYSNLEYNELQSLTETHLYDQSMPSQLFFAIEFENEQVGEMSLKSIRWFNRKAEIGIYLLKDFRKKGIAATALKLLLNHSFKTMNFHRLEAEVVDYNPQAKVLFEKLGFLQEGILREAKFFEGNYHDIISYGILAEEWKG